MIFKLITGAAMSALLSLSAVGSTAIAADDPAAVAPGQSLYGDPSAPDISGLYMGTFTWTPGYTSQLPTKEQNRTHWAPWPPPFTPEYQKRFDERLAQQKAGKVVGDTGARCLPFGLPYMFINGAFPDEIIETPGVVQMWIFGTFPIFVWTDGRGHPKDLKPSFNGHSIGYWVGDTLYVDTVGILPTTIYDGGPRAPHSDKLHIKTEFHKVDDNTIHVTETLYDADAFTEPMTTTNIWRRKAGPNWQLLDDASCFENNRNAPDAEDSSGFKKF